MTARLLDPSDPAWAATLARAPHDVFHEPAYAAAEAHRLGGRAVAALATRGDAALLLPLVLRTVPGTDRVDAVSPYAYPGPVFAGAPSAQDQTLLLDDLLAGLAAAGIVSLFVRLHPILNPGRLPTERGLHVEHGETVVLDLRRPPEEQWAETRSGHRTEIRRAIRAGHTVGFDETFDRFDAFRALYRGTMTRVGAHAEYQFDDRYLDALRAALGPGLRLCLVEIDGEVASAALITDCDGIVGYHLSGTDPRFARWAPAKLVLHHVRTWAAERGARWLHLGGGVGARADSLFAFKAGFGPGRRPFGTWRVVLDEDAYRGLGGDPEQLSGWFPAYRAEVAPAAPADGPADPADEASPA